MGCETVRHGKEVMSQTSDTGVIAFDRLMTAAFTMRVE